MLIPEATPSYSVDSTPVIARGLAYNEEQLDGAINGAVKDLLLDTTGTAELNDMLAGLAPTEFEPAQISQLLQAEQEPKNWLVGEALAEAYVADHNNCTFPWPTGRDLKNPEASPAGADLTGFQETDDTENPYRFAFGEVKTSSDEHSPPRVMYSRTGLKNQLEGLRDSHRTKKSLIRYLGHHAINASWWYMFKSATKRYLSSALRDVAIFGVLIRDIEPNESDLSCCAKSLANGCPDLTSISLYALYFPENAISLLKDKAQEALRGDEQ